VCTDDDDETTAQGGGLVSPNEAQLRAALHEGEGDPVDATAIIRRGLDIRRQRRTRFTAVAGGVAAAAVIGVGVTGLVALGSGSSGQGGGGSVAGGAGGSVQRAGGGKNPGADSAGAGQLPASRPGVFGAASREATQLPCPAQPERLLLPGGGGTGQFGGSGPLFGLTVAAVKICGYPENGPRSAAVLSASSAVKLVQALEAAPVTRTPGACRGGTTGSGSVELLAVSPTGVEAKPVVITLGCPTDQVTNGTAVRYPRTLPAQLVSLLPPAARPGR
jgi:hypothetical protein